MEVKSKGIELVLTFDEAIALTKLLGAMSVLSTMEYGLDQEEAESLQSMYGTLSAFVPNE